jgi:hypothetical protein
MANTDKHRPTVNATAGKRGNIEDKNYLILIL